MRHSLGHRKFSRSSSHRIAMFRNLATALLEREQISTTIQKAKDLRPIAEKLITLGRTDSVHNRRQAYGYLNSKPLVHKLFTEIGPRYLSRNGGYTRIVRTTRRPGDAAELAIIELIREDGAKVSALKSSAAKSSASKASVKTKKASTKKVAAEAGDASEAKEPAKKKAAPRAKKKKADSEE